MGAVATSMRVQQQIAPAAAFAACDTTAGGPQKKYSRSLFGVASACGSAHRVIRLLLAMSDASDDRRSLLQDLHISELTDS